MSREKASSADLRASFMGDRKRTVVPAAGGVIRRVWQKDKEDHRCLAAELTADIA
jgi:hypothetical protein